MRKEYIKCGIASLLGWNLFLFVLLYLKYLFFSPRLFHSLFGDTDVSILSVTGIVLGSIVWYAIGHYSRREYLVSREQYRQRYSHLQQKVVDKYFFNRYWAKYIGILQRITIFSIPVYALFRHDFFDSDFVVLLFLIGLSLVLYFVSKKFEKKSRL